MRTTVARLELTPATPTFASTAVAAANSAEPNAHHRQSVCILSSTRLLADCSTRRRGWQPARGPTSSTGSRQTHVLSPSPHPACQVGLAPVVHPGGDRRALGYFVDIYDLLLFSIVRTPSLKSLGVAGDALATQG